MKSTAFRETSGLELFGQRSTVAHRRPAATLAKLWDRPTRDNSAEIARLTGIRGWLLSKIVTLWISFALFTLVAFGARNSREVSMVCFFYALFAGVAAYMLQTKKPGAVLVAAIFSLLSGSILWLIYFVVSRRVKYTYARGNSNRQTNGAVFMRILSTVPESGEGIE